MKREWITAALLLFLFLAALYNIRCLDGLISDIEDDVMQAQRLAESGDFSAAKQAMDRAIEHWLRANAYTHIFIRHTEIDAASDAFYECRQAVAEQNAEGSPSAFDKLFYHLHSIDEMEHIRLGSIL